jgi:pimeloyl-ACP methyl ester carboxylesterase
VAGLIERLNLAPCRLVGTSLGAFVAQELALARPEFVSQAVLMATRGRTDTLRAALARAEIDLLDVGIRLPDRYAAVLHALISLSPRTLNDDAAMADWIDVFELTNAAGPGQRAQMESAHWTTGSPHTVTFVSAARSSPSLTTWSPRPIWAGRSPTRSRAPDTN